MHRVRLPESKHGEVHQWSHRLQRQNEDDSTTASEEGREEPKKGTTGIPPEGQTRRRGTIKAASTGMRRDTRSSRQKGSWSEGREESTRDWDGQKDGDGKRGRDGRRRRRRKRKGDEDGDGGEREEKHSSAGDRAMD